MREISSIFEYVKFEMSPTHLSGNVKQGAEKRVGYVLKLKRRIWTKDINWGIYRTMGLYYITKRVSRYQNTGHEVVLWALQYQKFWKKMKKKKNNSGRRKAIS